MSDPVAAKSTFLCMYMSNHPDTLVSYVRFWGKVKDGVASAKMAGIDTKGMDLTYTTKSGENKQVRVVFDPPLAGYEEVKPRLMNMKADAEEALGMTKAPQIDTYRLPPNAWKTAIPVIALVYTTFSPVPSSPSYSIAFVPAEAIRNALPSWGLAFCWYLLFALHSSECLYMLSLCRKHQTPFVPTLLYLISTFAIGFPSWVDFRRRVQAERIDSIMKGK
ncbi:hypothetical protein PHLGIDRAFT_111888 [Phlebiopsis gigantea 11061_1 CR5-6]|uniref:DUF2470 domain-containing protein n=1 Tax=Phlebiopsis gigantea (strain 11061_1 CR5-6) TaxID=745531 RepID=A0A0C3S3U4_PHLG1|nr:hypothetical protein PHLGIDRAFT_111888 [Phlebiopsis gigantea 11061_1 CR5-6]